MNSLLSISLAGLSLLTTFDALAQRARYWYEKPGTSLLNVGIGTTRYAGDMNEPGNFAHLRLGAALNVAFTHRLTYQLSLRAETQLYYIYGSHRYTRIDYNNLSFHSLNPDVWAGVQWDFWRVNNPYRATIPYALAGVGLTYMTPKATYGGNSYSLAPLHTEGVAYNRLPLIIRYGFGLPLLAGERFKLNLEGTYTHVQSDYLDDVSTVYPDRSGMSSLAVALSDRRAEIGLPANQPGEQRGNSTKNDGYFGLSGRLVIVLMTPQQRQYRRDFGR